MKKKTNSIKTALRLGEEYRDEITGFKGVCTGITVYLNGCIQALVTSRKLKDDGDSVSQWIDEQRLVANPVAAAGGPQPTPRGMPHP